MVDRKRTWEKNNPNYAKEYYQKNKDKIKERVKLWEKNNREKTILRQRKYRKDNPEKDKEYGKRWRNKNPGYATKYNKKRENIDPEYRLKRSLSKRLNINLKRFDTVKSETTIKLCGCNISELKKYLENKFIDNMSWDNYGEWHIDHIIPCVNFDLTDPKQQKICFHYTNLQPLWEKDNISKGSLYKGVRLKLKK